MNTASKVKMSDLFTTIQAAEYLGVSPATASYWTAVTLARLIH